MKIALWHSTTEDRASVSSPEVGRLDRGGLPRRAEGRRLSASAVSPVLPPGARRRLEAVGRLDPFRQQMRQCPDEQFAFGDGDTCGDFQDELSFLATNAADPSTV